MDLTDEQLEFLERNNIPDSKVFDASGMSPSMYGVVMSDEGAWIAYGVTPCRKYGHELRTRKGSCVQCDTSKIAYLRRWDEGGYVYLAYSDNQGLAKVGTAKDVHARINGIRSYGYASSWDWRLIALKECQSGAGAFESYLHKQLADKKTERLYIREGRLVSSYEVFDCSLAEANKVFKKAAKNRQLA